ncbi:hypothetical protein GCM10025867_02890 [Frondihabitans sucicola]|uniref:Multidrug DMT transporter permease n=1 Tax=Frondihabitans sucicola TaxID=1268041 RepID=A0ABM8GI53_9MICO|nr:DMT family transporter [Frondihabitans sucicola]BDZ48048.1 hypothetical protein GCM10025867_02890 [Frondihabitans sucicola]
MGILFALLAAVGLAVGTELQHRGVRAQGGNASPTSVRGFRALLAQPVWLLGALLIGISIVLQLSSLLLANLAVVQPLGAIGLLVSAYLQARRTRRPLAPIKRLGIALCMAGIATFVIIALVVGRPEKVTTGSLVGVLITLGILLVAAFLLLRVRKTALATALSAAVMFGFVATLAQIVLTDLIKNGITPVSIAAGAGLAAAGIAGSLWVQTAHSQGSSTLVLAGLTVIDPLTGVILTSVFFGTLAGASGGGVLGMLIAGVVATSGVLLVARD